MRYTLVLALISLSAAAGAQEWEDRQLFNEGGGDSALRIISSTDTNLFAPLIETFVTRNPDVAVEYLVTGTADIDRRFRASPGDFDIAISSAMDLQLKLANDGFALPLEDIEHPAWAEWRKSLFAFTSEPAAIVVNREAFDGHPIPQSRQELIEALRARPEIFHDRIGTYDVRRSGLGYLFATQDARASETFWRLMEVMGALDARLYSSSSQMIEDLSNGTIIVAYNVLGSYAEPRAARDDVLEIVLPSDFPTTMMRTALVSQETTQAGAAEAFIQFLVSYQWEDDGEARTLPPLSEEDAIERATIGLEPALLAFLDTLKRDKFLTEWENALIQD
ncbi:MAG: ABC transporter substrate-binding protein [Rhodobacteraceae bacterium]|nr:ABC transporter substrate-binding protein [Paracoccaceae bacterium]